MGLYLKKKLTKLKIIKRNEINIRSEIKDINNRKFLKS